MILYPTIELQNGRCVSLNRGRLDEPHLWHVDPVATAQGFAEAGAEWMHLTDLDAVDGSGGNEDLVAEIIRTVGIPVQLAGGIHSRDQAAQWIDRGAGRVVVGSLARRDPDAVGLLTRRFPDQIVLAVDVWDGAVVADGWRTKTSFAPDDFIAAFRDCPLAAVLVTDIDSDIADADASLALISGLAAESRAPVIASGIVRRLDDLSRLTYVRNVAGAIVGRALFQKTFSVQQALGMLRDAREPVAKFI